MTSSGIMPWGAPGRNDGVAEAQSALRRGLGHNSLQAQPSAPDRDKSTCASRVGQRRGEASAHHGLARNSRPFLDQYGLPLSEGADGVTALWSPLTFPPLP